MLGEMRRLRRGLGWRWVEFVQTQDREMIREGPVLDIFGIKFLIDVNEEARPPGLTICLRNPLAGRDLS